MSDWALDERILGLAARRGKIIMAHIEVHAQLIAAARAIDRYVDVTVEPWANPYPFGPNGERSDSLASYEQHLWTTTELVDALPNLRDKVLGCDCTLRGAVCHADTLAEAVNYLAACCRCGRRGNSKDWRLAYGPGLVYVGKVCDICELKALWPSMQLAINRIVIPTEHEKPAE